MIRRILKTNREYNIPKNIQKLSYNLSIRHNFLKFLLLKLWNLH